MRLDWTTIATLFWTELRMVLRDRRTVIASIVLPLAVMPIMLFASQYMAKRRERALSAMEYSYVVTGSQAALVRELMATPLHEPPGEASADSEKDTFTFREMEVDDPATSLEAGEIHLYLDAVGGAEGLEAWRHRRAQADEADEEGGEDRAKRPPEPGTDGGEPVDGVAVITLVYRHDRDSSEAAFRRLRQRLREVRTERRNMVLIEHGLAVKPEAVATVTAADVATEAQASGLQLGRLLTLLVLMFTLMGGSVVATDSLAGEKERGTLETLLTTAANRFDIIVAKHLLILAVALIITVIQVANLLVYVGFELIPVSRGFAAAVSPPVALLLLLLFLPLAALVASILLLTSGYARTYKEAQLYFFPVFLLSLAPAAAPFLPGVSLRSAIVLVPAANVAVAAKEVLIGVFDWPMLIVVWVVNAAAAVAVGVLAARTLSNERLITASEMDAAELHGGPALFERHVLRWFAIMWALLLAIAVNMGPDADLRLQLAVNLLGLFLGGSLLMIRRYRLPVKEALALRPVQPMVWLGVAVGVPGGLLTAFGVFLLANLVFPVPTEALESFGKALLPDSLPFWQVLALVTILPGICEEIAFRGVLLYGLRRRFHPAVVALVVGLAFGLFHTSLFRIAQTAFLGVVLASTTMITGSIFPAMVWHALSNLLGVLAGHYGWNLLDIPAGVYVAGVGLLALSFFILWRHRAPYPGLRPWRRGSLDRG